MLDPRTYALTKEHVHGLQWSTCVIQIFILPTNYLAVHYPGLLITCGEKMSNFAGFCWDKLAERSANCARFFEVNSAEKQSKKYGWLCGNFLNKFLILITCSFNNNTVEKWAKVKAFISWLIVPSFSQHNLCLVVLGHCC